MNIYQELVELFLPSLLLKDYPNLSPPYSNEVVSAICCCQHRKDYCEDQFYLLAYFAHQRIFCFSSFL